MEYPELKRAVCEQCEAFEASVVLIEDKAFGIQLIQELVADGLHAVTRYTENISQGLVNDDGRGRLFGIELVFHREGDADFVGVEQGQERALVGEVVAGVYSPSRRRSSSCTRGARLSSRTGACCSSARSNWSSRAARPRLIGRNGHRSELGLNLDGAD